MKKALIINILLTSVSIVINFAFKAYLANVAPKDVLATFYTSLDIINLFFIFFIGARSSMVVAYDKTKDDASILNIYRSALFFMFLLAWAIILPFVKYSLHLSMSYSYLVAMFFAFGVYIYYINQLGMYKMYFDMNAITIIEPLMLVFWFWLSYEYYSLHIIHSLVISTTMTYLCIAMYVLIKKTNKEPPIKKVVFNTDTIDFIKNASFASMEFVFSMLTVYIAVFLFIKYFTLSDLADYQVVIKPIYIYYFSMFVFPIFKFVLPALSSNIAKKEYIELQKTERWMIKYALIIGIASFLLVQLFAYDFVVYFFSSEYKDASILLQGASISFVFVILNAFYNTYIKSFGGFKITMIIKGVAIVLFVAIFFILEYIYSQPLNVIYATNLSHIIQTIMFLFFAKKYAKI